jgi:peptidyl-prolyl cis-trans isomerase C
MKKVIVGISLILALGAGGAAAEETGFVATVNGVGVAKAEFDRSWPAFLKQKGIPANHAETSGKTDEFRAELVDLLIDQELLYQAAQKGGHEAAAEQVEVEVAKAQGQFPTPEDFEKAMAGSGLDVKGYSAYLQRRITVLNMVQNEIAKSVTVTEEDITEFYKANIKSFAVPEQVKARHILITVEADADEAAREAAKKKIEEIIAKAKAGEDFSELAVQYSQGPSAPRGGDLGTFPKGKMVPPFEEAAFALEAGEISDPVLTRFGYHVIKVEEKQGGKTVSQAEAAPQITQFLKEKKTAEATKALLDSLRQSAKIEKTAT